MCGLIATIDTRSKSKPVNETIIDLYQDQYERGQEGFGLITLDKKNKITLKRATEPTKFMYDLNNNLSSMMFAHHRIPTSTKNKLSQTHPMLVDNPILKYKYYVMHNGMIRNCDDLKDEHEKMGFTYTTEMVEEITGTYYNGYKTSKVKFNDSESMAIEMALYIENLQKEVSFDGSAAFLILKVDKKTDKALEFIYGRHINPLNLQKEKGVLTLASEGPGEPVEEDVVHTIKLNKSQKKSTRELVFKEKPPMAVVPVNQAAITTLAGFVNTNKTTTIEAKPAKPVATNWTEEDQKELDEWNAGFSITTNNYDHVMDFALSNANALFEDFINELSVEDLACTVNIEEYLIKMKQIFKATKGQSIQFYRKNPGYTDDSIDEMDAEEIANGYTPKRYKSEVDDDYDDSGRKRTPNLFMH